MTHREDTELFFKELAELCNKHHRRLSGQFTVTAQAAGRKAQILPDKNEFFCMVDVPLSHEYHPVRETTDFIERMIAPSPLKSFGHPVDGPPGI